MRFFSKYALLFVIPASLSPLPAAQIDYGPGDVNTNVNVRGAQGGVANDHVIVGNTDIKTSGTSFYLELGTLTVDGSAGPIHFESSGVADNSAFIYLMSRTYGATSLDIDGRGQVYFHIDDQYTGNPPTYAIFVRGSELAEGRESVSKIDGINVLTESNGAVGILFSDSSANISNTVIETTGTVSGGNYTADGIFLQYATTLNISDTEITTRGSSSSGIVSLSSGVQGERLTIETYGNSGYGVRHGTLAGYAGTSKIVDSDIKTYGGNAIGVLMRTSNAAAAGANDAVYENTSVTTTGAGAHGVAVAGENMKLEFVENSVVESQGGNAYGVIASKNGEIAVVDSSVESKLDAALTTSLGGKVTVADSTIKGVVGVKVNDENIDNTAHYTTLGKNQVSVSGGSLVSTSGPAILVERKDQASLATISGDIVLSDGVAVVASNGVLLNNLVEDSEINLSVKNGTAVSGLITSVTSATAITSLSIDSTSSWTTAGNSNFTDFTLSGGLTQNGTVTLAGTMDITGGASVNWTNGSLILSDVFTAGVTGGKTLFTFSSVYDDMYVVIAEYDQLGISGADVDANDYFECLQGDGVFEFTVDNKLIYHMLKAVPEPASASLGLLGLGVLALRRKKSV